ncbi:MAG: DUF4404 family protein [Planctomycetota bacterium]|nr:DUF4404 family protein [Planctomycetota bacterium]
MQDAKLRESLEQLRREINGSGLGRGPALDRLNGLISDLETKLDGDKEDPPEGGLVDAVKESIGHLELEYPRTTRILNQILTTLGGAGI